MRNRISSGSEIFDELLNGGYELDVITTLYGPSGSGKTNVCLLPLVRMAGKGKKIIYIDTEGSLSTERLKQITKHYKKVLENILLFQPTEFHEQAAIISNLNKIVSDKIGLIVVDSIAMLYRLELGKTHDVYDINTALGQQIALLTRIARVKKIPVLITNQVYADFKNKDQVNMVGGDLLKYGSKCLIELKSYASGVREAVIRKHRSLPEGKKVKFRISNKGIEQVDAQKAELSGTT